LPSPSTDFKPRAQKDKSKYKKQALEAAEKKGQYRDRAAERRTGGPSDFAEAEKLLQVSGTRLNQAARLENSAATVARPQETDSNHSPFPSGTFDHALALA
jgi:hypothetical protein